MSYTAFVIDDRDRERLLRRYPPKFPDVYAHHVTFQMGCHSKMLDNNPIIVITGYIQTDYLELMLVTVDGRHNRPDGSKYHITWSLDRSKGVKPMDSNKVIQQYWDDKLLLVPCIVSGNMEICD
jgi:hypothetical protein